MLAPPNFPGRYQPSIFGANELNFRVRNGNGCTLTAISTNYFKLLNCKRLLTSNFPAQTPLKTLVTRAGFEPTLTA